MTTCGTGSDGRAPWPRARGEARVALRCPTEEFRSDPKERARGADVPVIRRGSGQDRFRVEGEGGLFFALTFAGILGHVGPCPAALPFSRCHGLIVLARDTYALSVRRWEDCRVPRDGARGVLGSACYGRHGRDRSSSRKGRMTASDLTVMLDLGWSGLPKQLAMLREATEGQTWVSRSGTRPRPQQCSCAYRRGSWQCICGGEVLQSSEQVWAGLQNHCRVPLFRQEPEQ